MTTKTTRKMNLKDIEDIRLSLFGKNGRGFFEVRTSPEDDGTEHGGPSTADSRKWNLEGSGADLDFPVCSYETKKAGQQFWPSVYEGITLDLYVRVPTLDTGPKREDWELWGNIEVTLTEGTWVLSEEAQMIAG